ncbi:MAG: class I SAM-dependent methyltransferase [Acidobacteriota bacterium]
MDTEKITDRAQIEALVAGHSNWYHQIELVPGVTTPGCHNSSLGLEYLEAMGLPADCTGQRVLDIGCMDGFFAFEMERRGAEVVGLDYADPEITGFSIASRVLGSRVEHRTDNVYELGPESFGTFDIVLFLGVLYHLRNPMLALDRIRTVIKDGGLLFVETQLSTEPEVHRSTTPLWHYFPRSTLHQDGTNKWAPNPAGLRSVIEECEFEVLQTASHGDRGYVRARAISDHELDFFRRLDSAAGLWGK